jgi:microsomal dipeptidase-like Zn-dependent dipeptidase
LGTGHVSVEEAVRVVDLAEEYGISKVLVSSSVTKIAGLEQLRHMADKGAFLEYTLAAYTHTTPIPKTHYYVEREYSSMDEGMAEEPAGGVRLVAEQIKALGADHCIIGTDFGVYTLPPPVEGLREFIACLLDLGIPVEDIYKLVRSNPERLLGLES